MVKHVSICDKTFGLSCYFITNGGPASPSVVTATSTRKCDNKAFQKVTNASYIYVLMS